MCPMFPFLTTIALNCFLPGSNDLLALFQSLVIVFNASHGGSRFIYKCNFITSLGKLMASQQVFIAISRIYINVLGLLDGLRLEQQQNKTKTNQVTN